MLYARDEHGESVEPTRKGQRATCPGCQEIVLAKYGEIVAPHWAHVARSDCDTWGEPEGAWHREWKSVVDRTHCEVTMRETHDGVAYHHRADMVGNRRHPFVAPDSDGTRPRIVVELQHSPISTEVVRQRETFYRRMVWLFDAAKYDLRYFRVETRRTQQEIALRRRVPQLRHDPKLATAARRSRLLMNEMLAPYENIVQAIRPLIECTWVRARHAVLSAKAPVYLDLGRPVGRMEHPYDRLATILHILDYNDTSILCRALTPHEFLAECLLETVTPDIHTLAGATLALRRRRLQQFRAVRTRARQLHVEKVRAQEDVERQAQLARQAVVDRLAGLGYDALVTADDGGYPDEKRRLLKEREAALIERVVALPYEAYQVVRVEALQGTPRTPRRDFIQAHLRAIAASRPLAERAAENLARIQGEALRDADYNTLASLWEDILTSAPEPNDQAAQRLHNERRNTFVCGASLLLEQRRRETLDAFILLPEPAFEARRAELETVRKVIAAAHAQGPIITCQGDATYIHAVSACTLPGLTLTARPTKIEDRDVPKVRTLVDKWREATAASIATPEQRLLIAEWHRVCRLRARLPTLTSSQNP